jgi:hypothetical protein
MLVSRNALIVAAIAIALGLANAWYAQSLPPTDVATGPLASRVPETMIAANPGAVLDKLPASGAGVTNAAQLPAGKPAAPAVNPANPEAALPPLTDPALARGRVERLYVRAAQGVLIDLAAANNSQRDGWRYAAVEFPDPMANGATRALALIPEGEPAPAIGDVVEMHFANRAGKGVQNYRFFFGVERDHVTQVVARSGTAIAQSFERRILASSGIDTATGARPDPALWKSLPFERAVKIVRGNGSQEIAVFSDPNCVACRAFEQTLAQMDDVTIHVFMVPLIRPDLAKQSKSIWCSADRAQAWTDLTHDNKAPTAEPTCDNPIDANLAMRQAIDIRATPTILFSDGQRTQGNIPAGTLRQRLARANSQSVARAGL